MCLLANMRTYKALWQLKSLVWKKGKSTSNLFQSWIDLLWKASNTVTIWHSNSCSALCSNLKSFGHTYFFLAYASSQKSKVDAQGVLAGHYSACGNSCIMSPVALEELCQFWTPVMSCGLSELMHQIWPYFYLFIFLNLVLCKYPSFIELQ